jgi:hypothetical protein
MRKKYFCRECKTECGAPTYLRLQLTRCGWTRVSELPRWQKSIPVGHFCEACLWARVRTAMGRDFDLSQVERRSGRTIAPIGCAHKTSPSELRRKIGANPGNARVATRNDGPDLPPRSLISGVSALAGPE